MREKDMENLIAQFPDDFYCFHGKGFVLKGRQQTFAGVGRFDLLFEDCYHNSILMELKAERFSYSDVADQIGKYNDALEKAGNANVVMYVVAPDIPNHVRKTLSRSGIECAEISEAEFRRVAKKDNYPWPEEFEATKPTGSRKPRAATGGGGRTLNWIVPKPYPDRFQHVLVPLIRVELSRKQLTDQFFDGVDGVVDWANGLVDRSEDRAKVRNWITARLTGKGLDPASKGHPLFKYVTYPENGSVVDLTMENVSTIGDDIPLRILCRPIWFRLYGRNTACERYLGGAAENQAAFYGKDGKGGRFPVRPGTEIPGDLP
ncbi:MAG: endonuclease NucS domain-containing protein [Terriglobia bacterium]